MKSQFQRFQQQQQQQRQRMAQGAAWQEQQKRQQQMAEQAGPAVQREVDQRFSQVEQEAARLRQQFAAGKLSDKALVKKLSELMVQDVSGTWWMVGTESGRWYRYDGKDWVPGIPPGRAAAGIGSAASVKIKPAGIRAKLTAFFNLIVGIFISVIWFVVAHAISYEFLLGTEYDADLYSFVIAVIVGSIPLIAVIRQNRKETRG